MTWAIYKQGVASSESNSFLLCAEHGEYIWRFKSVMGAISCQPLAQGKGVHREVESEGSRRQISGRRNTNIIRHILWISLQYKTKSHKLNGNSMCKWCRYMERRLLVLPREVSRTHGCELNQKCGQQLLWEVSRSHSTEKKSREGLNLD